MAQRSFEIPGGSIKKALPLTIVGQKVGMFYYATVTEIGPQYSSVHFYPTLDDKLNLTEKVAHINTLSGPETRVWQSFSGRVRA